MRRNILNFGQNGVPQTPNSLDPDLASYFLVRGRTTDSPNASPSFVTSRKTTNKSPTVRSQRTEQSADSTKSKRPKTRGGSAGSAVSMTSKYRHIQEWNEKSSSGISPGNLTPASFETQRHPSDPPRPPKVGFEWVWFPEGYWAEREIRGSPVTSTRRTLSRSASSHRRPSLPRQRWWNGSPEKSKAASVNLDAEDKPAQKVNVPVIKIGSLVSRRSGRSASEVEKSSRHSSKAESLPLFKMTGFRFMKSDTDLSTSDQQAETLGLYCRTKKHIQKRLLTPITPKPVSPTVQPGGYTEFIKSRLEAGQDSTTGEIGFGSRTTTVLEGASSYFAQQHRGKVGAPTPAIHTPTSPASPDARSRRVFGLAPWHRKNSHDSLLSVSSSVHLLLMGRTPAATPNPERSYAGHEGRTYPRVEISSPDPHEPTFLPSEAKRINTPPLSPCTPSASAGARGFFFDLKAAQDPESPSPTTSAGSGSANGKVKSPGTHREWWESDGKHTAVGYKSSEKKTNFGGPLATVSAFELSLPPEHFPSSPLCPRNPMHPSGGTGICPFHGRRKSVGLKAIKRADTGGTSMSGTTNTTGAS